MLHSWVIETLDGRPAGDADVYRCTRCGACAQNEYFHFNADKRWLEAVVISPEEARAFIPGPALDLSADCAVASEQIRSFVNGLFYGHVKTPEDRLIGYFIQDKIRKVKDVTNFIPLVDYFLDDFRHPRRPPTMEGAKKLLVEMKLIPPDPSV